MKKVLLHLEKKVAEKGEKSLPPVPNIKVIFVSFLRVILLRSEFMTKNV